MTVWEILAVLEAKRTMIRSEVYELKSEGASVVVDADAVFLCELAGLVVDLGTGKIVGTADERVAAGFDCYVQHRPQAAPDLAQEAAPRALLYARVAGVNRGELSRQLTICRQLAQAQGYEVIGEFQEYAGDMALERPQLELAVALALQGEIDVLVALNTLTLIGDGKAWQSTAKALLDAGVKINYAEPHLLGRARLSNGTAVRL